MAEDKPIPPPPQTDFVPLLYRHSQRKRHGEYAAKWLQDNPDEVLLRIQSAGRTGRSP